MKGHSEKVRRSILLSFQRVATRLKDNGGGHSDASAAAIPPARVKQPLAIQMS